MTIEKLATMVANGFASTATKDDIVAIRKEMATKDDIKNLEFKIEDTERRLSTKIDHVDEKIDALEITTIRPLEQRVSVLEKRR